MPRVNHEVKHRDGRPGEECRSDRSGNQRQGKPLKDGVGENDACADHHRGRGEQHGPKASRAGVNHRFGQRHSLANPKLDEVDEND